MSSWIIIEYKRKDSFSYLFLIMHILFTMSRMRNVIKTSTYKFCYIILYLLSKVSFLSFLQRFQISLQFTKKNSIILPQISKRVKSRYCSLPKKAQNLRPIAVYLGKPGWPRLYYYYIYNKL